MKQLKMVINPLNSRGTINRNLFGQFIEQTGRIVNDGLYVGEDSPIPNKNGVRLDVLEAFRDLKVPLLHWPGGYTTEFYHWRNGIGPKGKRPRIPDTLTGRDTGVPLFVDDNGFGTHEFFNLCEELGCEPYLVFGSGQVTPEEIHDWVEYITFAGDSTLSRLRRQNGRDQPWKMKYMTVGNEWWFYESAASYVVRYCRGIHFGKNYSGKTFRVLRGPQIEDIQFTDQLMDALPPDFCDAMTVYIVMNEEKFGQKLKAVDFDDEEYYASLQFIPYVDRQLDRHIGVIRKNPRNDHMRICVDEWGCWHDTGKEANWEMRTTMRDAIIAAATLNTFANKCDFIEMAALCMTVNALHCILKTHGDQMIKTPSYYVFEQYIDHQDARQVDSWIERDVIHADRLDIPTVSHCASMKDGKMLLSLVNCSASEPVQLNGTILDSAFSAAEGYVLCADPRAENTFEQPSQAVSKPFSDYALHGSKLEVTLPPCSVVTLSLKP